MSHNYDIFWLETSRLSIILNRKITISNHASQDAKMIPDGVTGRKLERHSANICLFFAAVSTGQTTRDRRMWAKTFCCELADLIVRHLWLLTCALSLIIVFAKSCDLRKKRPSYLRSIKFLVFLPRFEFQESVQQNLTLRSHNLIEFNSKAELSSDLASVHDMPKMLLDHSNPVRHPAACPASAKLIVNDEVNDIHLHLECKSPDQLVYIENVFCDTTCFSCSHLLTIKSTFQ